MNYLHKLANLPKEERAEKGIEYTPFEIESQPRLWIENLHTVRKREDEVRSFIEAKIFSRNSPRVILSGAGSSAFIGLAAQNLLRCKWRLDVDARATTDIVMHWSSIFLKHTDNTMISFSRSGNSPESIGAIILAKQFSEKVNHIVVTCNKEGRLATTGSDQDRTLLLLLSEETNDKGLAMTASFTTMLMTAQFLACINDPEKYERIISNLSRATEKLFENYSEIIKEISELSFNRALFLGSGCLYGCAVESSLKLQELTAGRIICKADTFMGVRHGPEAIIDDNTIVVYFLSTDPFVRRYELDLVKEIDSKGVGMKKIVVCNRADRKIGRCVDYTIEFDKDDVFKIPDAYRPVMDVTVGQMMGLFKSLDLNLKPDSPSERGIITRTVRGVRIYDHETFRKERRFKVILE